jgi:catechol 2,3-dioxygenase-like lactoylglutathione lyase family enzyme
MIMPILAVKDVDASSAFYKDVLGFSHDFSMPGPDNQTSFAGVSLGKAAFGLSLSRKRPKAARAWCSWSRGGRSHRTPITPSGQAVIEH